MSIFLDRNTRVIVSGITGNEGKFWTEHMIALGTKVVCGVTPGKEGMTACGVPVYHSVRRALAHHEVDAAMLFVPPRFTKDAVYEMIDHEIKKIVTIADGIPVHEAAQIRALSLARNAMVIGGNTSGVITPGEAMMGAFPFWIKRVYQQGDIGVMTRSGSLTNEVTAMIVSAGFGVSSLVGVGGDSVPCTRFVEILSLFQEDKNTVAVVMIGELGGSMEEEVALAIEEQRFTKPMVAFIGGRTAPEGKRMGHAGAIISGGKGSVGDKVEALENAGVAVADRPSAVGRLLSEILI